MKGVKSARTTHQKLHFANKENFMQVARPKLSPKAKVLAELLLAHARNYECSLSMQELSKLTGWHRATISRYLNELERAQLVVRRRRPQRPTVYQISDVAAWRRRLHGEENVQDLHRIISAGGHVLILGPEGSGKSYLLSRLSMNGFSEQSVVLTLAATPVKQFLQQCWAQLVNAGEVSAMEQLVGPRVPTHELGQRVLTTIAQSPRHFLLFIDDLDRAPPALRAYIAQLLGLDNVQIVGTARDEQNVMEYVDHCFVWPIPPLSRSEVHSWVATFIEARGIPVVGGERGLRRLQDLIWIRSQGNPRKVQALLRKVEAQGYVDRKMIRSELNVGGRFRFFDMTWLIVLAVALAMAVRYLSLGLHDRTLYVLAGFAYALGLVLRWFSYRWRGKK